MNKLRFLLVVLFGFSGIAAAQCSPEICYSCSYPPYDGGRTISYDPGTPGYPSICSDSGCQPFTC